MEPTNPFDAEANADRAIGSGTNREPRGDEWRSATKAAVHPGVRPPRIVPEEVLRRRRGEPDGRRRRRSRREARDLRGAATGAGRGRRATRRPGCSSTSSSAPRSRATRRPRGSSSRCRPRSPASTSSTSSTARTSARTSRPSTRTSRRCSSATTPRATSAMNARQAGRLKRLRRLAARARAAVPVRAARAADARTDRASPATTSNASTREERPKLMKVAIAELQERGVEPDIWKIEGIDRREDCEMISATTRSGRARRGGVRRPRPRRRRRGGRSWLRHARSGVPGYLGFAIGRSIWWDPLKGFVDGNLAVARRPPSRSPTTTGGSSPCLQGR